MYKESTSGPFGHRFFFKTILIIYEIIDEKLNFCCLDVELRKTRELDLGILLSWILV